LIGTLIRHLAFALALIALIAFAFSLGAKPLRIFSAGLAFPA